MISLARLQRETENLDPDDGIKLTSESEVSILFDNGTRIDLPHDLAKKIFGSVENLERLKDLFDQTESLELHNVKISDEIWLVLDEVFACVEEV